MLWGPWLNLDSENGWRLSERLVTVRTVRRRDQRINRKITYALDVWRNFGVSKDDDGAALVIRGVHLSSGGYNFPLLVGMLDFRFRL